MFYRFVSTQHNLAGVDFCDFWEHTGYSMPSLPASGSSEWFPWKGGSFYEFLKKLSC